VPTANGLGSGRDWTTGAKERLQCGSVFAWKRSPKVLPVQLRAAAQRLIFGCWTLLHNHGFHSVILSHFFTGVAWECIYQHCEDCRNPSIVCGFGGKRCGLPKGLVL
jgi:hypothetical protein